MQRGSTNNLKVMPVAQSRRIPRQPSHHFNLVTRPYGIYPFMIAPVLPGETMKNLLMQSRVITDPVISRLTGWWKEYYWFYVKLRDFDASLSEALQAMVLDAEYDISAQYEAASTIHYHHAGGINFTKWCLKRVTECYFRNVGEAWDNVSIESGIPAAGFDKLRWLDSVVPDSQMDPTDDPELTVGADDKITGSEVEDLRRRWDFYRKNLLSEMTFEDFLRSYGVRIPHEEEEQKPELLRYVRDWKYPVSAIDPADGSAANAVTWAITERGDKDRLFREPGFIFGVTISRPKLYFGLQNASLVSSMTQAFRWLPALMKDDLNISQAEITTGANGPLSSWTGNYWVDFRDLYLYGDQFVNWSMVSDTTGQSVAMPTAAGNKEYPTAAMVDALFADATNYDRIREDGIVNLNILGTQVDNT